MAKKKSSRSRSKKGKRRSSSRKKKKKQQPRLPSIQLSRDAQLDILGYVMLAIAALTILALLSVQRGALLGPWVALLTRIFGWGVYVVPFFIGAVGLYLVLRHFGDRVPRPQPEQVVGIILLFVNLLVTIHFPLMWVTGLDSQQLAEGGQGGGTLGAGLGNLLVRGLGGPGTALALLALWTLSIFFVFGVSPAEMARELAKLAQRLNTQIRAARMRRPIQPPLPSVSPTQLDLEEAYALEPADPTAGAPQPDSVRVSTRPDPGPISEYVHPRVLGEQSWQPPALDAILEPGDTQDLDQEMMRQQARIIEETLTSLGAPVKVMEVNQGPAITQFGVEPLHTTNKKGKQTRVKVSKVAGLADDVALALSAKTIRIQTPIPRKGLIGIEIPNQDISLVALRDIIESESWQQTHSRLRLGLGQDVSGMPFVASLTAMPHLLIAGATGSGKSVCINSILAALLLQNTPADLRLLMVDPKRVELTQYGGIPHLLAPVIVDVERVPGALNWLLREMDGRYRKFANVGARDIDYYNEHVIRDDPDARQMPYIVVVVDELADLMMLAPQETERSICRLAQMARATGIHLIIATQRPSVDVVTGLIKANFSARIAFAVASSVDSRVILDGPGAERLMGRGDMLFVPPDAAEPIRLQGAFVADEELRRLVRYWKGGRELREPEPAPTPQPSPPVQLPLQEQLVATPVVEFEDDLLPHALSILLAENRASISLLQRRLRIGYTRSARIIDLLTEKGIVGPSQPGGKAREINRAQAQALLQQAGGR